MLYSVTENAVAGVGFSQKPQAQIKCVKSFPRRWDDSQIVALLFSLFRDCRVDKKNRLCGLVVRLATYPQVPGSIPGATRFSGQ
jgi:hypothetical protein